MIGFIYFLWAKLIGVKIITYFQREVYKKRLSKIKDIIEKNFIKASNDQCISPCLGNLKYKNFPTTTTYLPFSLPVNGVKKYLNNKINIWQLESLFLEKNICYSFVLYLW